MKMVPIFNIAIRFVFVTIFVSCAHKTIDGDLIAISSPLIKPSLKHEYDFSAPQLLKHYIQNLKLNTPQDQETLIRLLIAFSKLTKNINTSELSISPRTKIKVNLQSFCAASQKAIPENNEIFQWVKGTPSLMLVKRALNFYNQNQVSQTVIQELLWNLGNETYYEDYPANLRKILDNIASPAKWTLPSRAKSKIVDEIMPEQIKSAVDFAKGEYYSFSKFRSLLEQKKSSLTLSLDDLASKIPNTELLASTKSNGFSSQETTFYNPTSKTISIHLKDYYLQPVRTDVQPVILASVIPQLNEMQKILEEAALRMLGYIGSQYPTLNSHEKQLVQQHPIDSAIAFYDAITSERNGDKFFPNSSENGNSDAFRHFVWAGLLTRDLGQETARKFLEAHELSPGQPLKEKAMDEFNNERGMQWSIEFLKNGNFEDRVLFDQARDEIKRGNLKILNYEKK